MSSNIPITPMNYSLGRVSDWLSRLVPERCNTFRQHLYALVLAGVALLTRLAIAPIDEGIQYITFFPAVAIAAVLGGIGPGLLAAAIGLMLASYFFWPPYMAFSFEFRHDITLSNGVFLIDAILVSTTIEAMHRFYHRYVNAEQDLRLAASVFDHTAEGVMITDANRIIISVNPAFSAITGYTKEEALGRKPSLLRSDHHGPEFYRAIWACLDNDGLWQGEIWNRNKSGGAYLEWLTINRIDNADGVPVRYVGVFHDITEQHRQADQIRHLAFHDALTGLPNRTLFQERLGHAIERSLRDKALMSVTFIDLDGFKGVNDSLGHDVGDLLLQEVALRLKTCLRRSVDTVARLGGDEFVILMEDLKDPKNCSNLAIEIIASLQEPMELRGNRVQVGASLGMAFFPEDGTDALALMQKADMAMYAAKAAGKGTYRFFRPEMQEGGSNAESE